MADAATARAKQTAETITLGQLIDRDFPPDDFIISEGLLPKGGLLFIGGPPKSYKSFVMNTMIYHLAIGTNLFGAYRSQGPARTNLAFDVAKPQRILLLEQEIGQYDLRLRLLPLLTRLPREQQLLLRESIAIRSRDHTMRLDTPDGLATLRESISAFKPDIVCFDPLIDFHGSDENNAREMTATFRNLRILQEDYGFSTIMSHHIGKPDATGIKDGPDMLRGSSVIFAKGDSYMMLKPTNRNAGIIRVDFTIRRGAPIHPFYLMLDWEELRAKFKEWHKDKTSGLSLSKQ